MVTRFYVRTNRPTERLNLHVSSASPLPKSYRDAFSDPNWQSATLFGDGTLSRYKDLLVANGSTQLEGVDVDETFSPVVKPGTIRTVLSLAVSRHWSIHQLDVNNVFLHGDLSETVYMHQPPGSLQCLTFTRPYISYAVQQVCLYMHDPREPYFSTFKRVPRYVRGTLDYGLQLFSSSTTDLVAYSDADWAGWPNTRRSTSGYCVFLSNNLLSWSSKRQPTLSHSSAETEYPGVANAVAETCWLRNLLRELHTPLSFATLVYCDNVSAVYLSSNLVQHQRTKHIEIDIHFVHNLVASGQVCVLHVPSHYQFAYIFTKGFPLALFEEFCTSLSVRYPPAPTTRECSLQCLTFTRPYISYAVQQVCLYMHDPREPYFSTFKRVPRYVRGTLDYGLQLFSSSTTDLVAYSDADWAGWPTTRRSTSGYCVFLSNNLLSWSSKRQPTLSHSSAETEYPGVANAVAETCWLRNLLRELHTPLSFATLVYCDNVSAVYLSSNLVQHQRTKHIEIDIHFVHNLVASGQVCVLHVPSRYQFAYIFTKGLPLALFEEFRTSLSVRYPPAPTTREC
nr:ribonuclease H-like domain-containing protein [Tanacetum cinerariifolium]